ncbi:YjgN family protein [Deinococcus humi]|uniref:Uncharacterized membrane protein YjgN (DUF898 family) n=1 Tax=Deinococcus humi TaxID=662880 RepID=A0A7W8JTI8_9DEIO|nr:YjgN family protein [Deinococcus humi]MBB5362665.1 uncharacterized membrane protein YjgN (DUF898 family) [Deinococcus humi]GGO31198.1 hypothetical protein GCM10008949_26820 [Deinococcus humi]
MTDPAAPPNDVPVFGRHVQSVPTQATQPGPVAPTTVTEYPVGFTATADEYFRLWIVNVALTFVTLGLYLPWARVRNRQYFHGHTWVDGQNFEYRANPAALLRGYLIVAALFVAYAVSGQFERTKWVAVVLVLIYAVAYPVLVRQSMRFQAVNTVHRGLRFRFHGTPGEAYVAYMLANVVASLSFGLALPWAWYMQRRYQVQGLAYGSARATFRGDVGKFYLIGLTALGLTIGGGVVIGVPLFILGVWLFGGDNPGMFDPANLVSSASFLVAAAVGYLSVLVLYAVAWQYVRGATMAYVLNNMELGGVVRTRATFSPWRLVWISLTNAAARVLTLGLASPWAAVRQTRYVLGGLTVRAIAPLDDFAAGVGGETSAFGEAATELLDIQVGF